MKRLFTVAGLLFLTGVFTDLQAQTEQKHFVYIKDKSNSPYSLSKPQEFLSEAALKRRQNQNIKLNSRDLPVNPDYVTALKNAGANVIYKSKWFNGAVIFCDSNELARVNALPFVKNATVLERSQSNRGPEKFNDRPVNNLRTVATKSDYGIAYRQAEMIGATRLHEEGFRGEGKTIAVFDAGFPGVNTALPFAHLYQNGQIKGVYNFVENSQDVYKESSHGTMTLSCIGAYLPGTYIGTAFKANFYLFVTEYAPTEHHIEEFNWLMAAEYADSAGVDVINSSLGYTTFDFPSAGYTYKDLDGNTTFITKAADFAAATGILVVNSAGNEGNVSWRFVGAPADGDSVLAVGAVDSTGRKASFSSVGPTFDGRIKPNVSAQGALAAVVFPNGQVGRNNGTSFSSPIMAGMAAAFWQAFPNLTNMEVIKYLQLSGSQVKTPDNNLGYGIPDYFRAKRILDQQASAALNVFTFPNPSGHNEPIMIDFENNDVSGPVQVKIFDSHGKFIDERSFQKNKKESIEFRYKPETNAGVYIMQVMFGNQVKTHRLIKLQ